MTQLTCWKVTQRSGEECYFGNHSAARAYARQRGTVEKIIVNIFDKQTKTTPYKLAPVKNDPCGYYNGDTEDIAQNRILDMSMLIKRLVARLKKFSPADDLCDKATDYLNRNNLMGSPLRDPPKGYTAEDLEQDNPNNQWMRES